MSGNRSGTYLIVGIILIGLNAFAFAPYVSDATLETVRDTVESGYDDEEDYSGDDEWSESVSQRTYFAYSMTNPSDVLEGNAPEFTKMGPFIYNVTVHNDLLGWNSENATITYSSYDVFEHCADCVWEDSDGVEHQSLPEDTQVTNQNILWNTQLIAGISTGIEYGEQFAKAGFTKSMMTYDMMYLAPSMDTADQISELVSGAEAAIDAQTGGQLDALTVSAMADAMVLDGFFASWNATLDDSQRQGLGADVMSPDFSAAAGSIMNSAVDASSQECMALTCDYGPWMVAAWGEPSSVITPLRADLLGYGTTDPAEMTLMDWAVYAGAASMMQANGAGVPPELASNESNSHKVGVLTGYDFKSSSGEIYVDELNYFLFGVNEATGYPAGMLAEQDLSGIPLYGVVLSLLPLTASPPDYMGYIEEYSIPGILTMQGVAGWSSGWQLAETHFPMRVVNPAASGTMDADTWWKMSFGGEEPLLGGNIAVGLNRNMAAGEGSSLALEKVDEILYDGPYALTNSDMATMFMYGELSGMTFPMTASGPGVGGVQSVWDDSHVAGMYGISESDASLLRSWVNDLMFGQVVGLLLNFQYGAGPLTTQSISNWLYGWSDPVLVGLYGAENSWVSLETNATYYGSGGLSTGDYSVYEETTSADGGTPGLRVAEGYLDSETGEIYGMGPDMPWRSDSAEEATLGLLSSHVGNDLTDQSGAIGGIVNDPDEPQLVNLVGYALADTEVIGDIVFKDIPMVHHRVSLEPTENQIQAKLIGSGTVIDVLPGALPVYFESNVDIYVEEITGIAMYGKSKSTFHLDLRGPGMMDPVLNVDTHPVFEIHTASEIGDDDAGSFVSAVIDNQGMFFWTDFGSGADGSTDDLVDFLAFGIYVLAVGLLVAGARGRSSTEAE